MTVKEHLNKKVRDTLVDSIDITSNKELVSEIMKLPLRNLESVSDLDLSRYIIALSQYVVFLRKQINFANLKYFLFKKQFDEKMSEEMLNQDGKTLTERREKALQSSEALKGLQDNMDKHEAERILLDKIDDSIIHYINALKKEQSRRDNERYVSRKERS